MDAVGALDQKQAIGNGMLLDVCNELFDIGEDVVRSSELFDPMWPAEVDRERRSAVRRESCVELVMCIVARRSEFVHIPEDDGAWAIHWCDVEKVVQSGVHT